MTERREQAEALCAACNFDHRGTRRYETETGLGWHDFEPPNLDLVSKRVLRSLRRDGVIR